MIKDSVITKKYAIYNGDCVEVMQDMPAKSIDLSVYSPPFGGMYCYSSDDRDLSNCDDYDGFFEHYKFVVSEIERITKPGRMTVVHCMDVPLSNSGTDSYRDFPGDIIRLHQRLGFEFAGRHNVWKEPLHVRLRTMQKNLAHKTFCDDSMDAGVASADYVILFRKKGKNAIPVSHDQGITEYMGERQPPSDVIPYRGWTGKQTENRFSQWCWRNYASSTWDDVRIGHVLPYESSRDSDDEKHVHPLQLDVIERIVQMRSNPGEVVFTPFMGVGSEVYVPVIRGRKGIGVELKESYFRQAVKNVESASSGYRFDKRNDDMFGDSTGEM